MKNTNKNFLLYPKAIDDMRSIYLYSLKNFGHELAIQYSRKLEIGFKKITDSPEVARKCDYIRHGLHAINIESHIIFFKIKNNQPNIIRILHKSMDYIRHFINTQK